MIVDLQRMEMNLEEYGNPRIDVDLEIYSHKILRTNYLGEKIDLGSGVDRVGLGVVNNSYLFNDLII